MIYMRYPDWVGLMDVTTDYWPFPSKDFALLYFLQNNPNPTVSTLAIVTSLCVHVERMSSVHQAVIIG